MRLVVGVTGQPASALPALSGIAMNLPLDGDTAGSRDGSARVSLHTLAGVPELHDPMRGRIKGEHAFTAFAAEMKAWLAEVDASGSFALANDSLCRLLGESREALLAMKMGDIVHAEDREDLALSMHRVFARDVADFITEKRFLRHDGAERGTHEASSGACSHGGRTRSSTARIPNGRIISRTAGSSPSRVANPSL